MCINAALQVRRGIRLRLKEEQQEFEIHLLEYQIKEQRKHQQALVENQKKLRRQRHDLRHQLTVIRDYNLENRRKELDDFIESLLADIPLIREVRYCENDAVNAVIAYYISGASREGIRTDVQIAVPQKIRDVSDKALCIIFGNLLENAIEACQRMTPESEKYIRLRSMIHLDTLVITMENTYNGKVRKWGKKFVSSKREEIGIGLSSIESIVKAVDGEARFEPEETVFRSMVYLRKPARDRSRGAEKKYEEGAVPQTTV
jgi:sensor histidine kinase regulating citrate/malate metabolism